MKAVSITQGMRDSAEIESNRYKNRLNNSIRSGQGTMAGCLGEEIFHTTYPFMARENTSQYDFAYVSPSGKVITFDVKTKERTVHPQPYYDCSVNVMNGKQDVDYYVFAQVLDTYEIGWLLGFIKASDYFERATLHLKGSLDPSNRFTFHCDTYNMPISDLREFKK